MKFQTMDEFVADRMARLRKRLSVLEDTDFELIEAMLESAWRQGNSEGARDYAEIVREVRGDYNEKSNP